MASLRLRVLSRSIGALFGLVLLFALFMLQVLATDFGWTPKVASGLFLLGAPSGVLLYFARTGRWTWGAALPLPFLVIVQSLAIRRSLILFPHSEAIRLTASVTASWLLAVAVYFLQSRRFGERPTA